VQLHYSPVHLQPYYRQLGLGEGQFPHSEFYATTAISLPLFPGLAADHQQWVVDKFTEQLHVHASQVVLQ
jgi:dTDP-4-amino-4,6-dideoxygalactose transaminase